MLSNTAVKCRTRGRFGLQVCYVITLILTALKRHKLTTIYIILDIIYFFIY